MKKSFRIRVFIPLLLLFLIPIILLNFMHYGFDLIKLKNEPLFLIISVIFIVFGFEAILFVTNNMIKPINILLDAYNSILNEEDIKTKEHNINHLSKAFDDMKKIIEIRTNRFLFMKKFNEDILKNIDTGIITADINGDVISLNESANNLITHLLDLNSREDIIKIFNNQILNTLKTNKNINEIIEFELKSDILYFDISTIIMKNSSNQNSGVICSFKDITKRKKLENKIERIDKLASLGELSAALAHEIRNPLSGIKMSAQVLSRRFKKYNQDESNEKLFEGIIKEIDRLDNLIKDILSFSKHKTIKQEQIELKSFIENSLKFFINDFEKKDINIKLDIKEDKFIYFDKNQLTQIFLNLISNALKAVELKGNILIRVSNYNDKYVKCEVIDDGRGIEKENIKKIFNPFFTTNEDGTGLGLSVVFELLNANDANIEVENNNDKGCNFKLFLPIYRGL
ncbi:MAG: ATP-binding protein [Peptostreptococcaceae bacterium]|nr:ATP-binding protein [Peptostreptococcaceae bacterium]